MKVNLVKNTTIRLTSRYEIPSVTELGISPSTPTEGNEIKPAASLLHTALSISWRLAYGR